MAEFDPNRPSIARVYDYLLEGKDNFRADRILADRLMEIAPSMRDMVRENRALLTRAVRWAAEQGIGQFLDLGCGLPTEPSTVASVREIVPGARVAYVDNDPVVINHLQALYHKEKAVAVVFQAAPGPDTDRLLKMYSAGPHQVRNHPVEEFASFFGDLELVPPGVADARTWQPDRDHVPDPEPRGVWTYGAMARKVA